MSMFEDPVFFLYLALVSIPAAVLGFREKRQAGCGLAVSLLTVALVLKDSPGQVLSMAVYCLWQLLLVRGFLALRNRTGRHPSQLWGAVLLSLLPLAAYKVSALFGAEVFGFLGISYMTFKALQMIIEIYDGLIDECRPRDFLYFMIFFPCLASGPIDRSRRFCADLQKARPRQAYAEMLGRGLFMLCLGMTYTFVLGDGFWQAIAYLGNGRAWWQNLVYMYAYGLYLFFDFAGFSLMARGSSYIFGIETPENFNKPFLSTDIKDFWNRWHITLSHWFRDFVFTRFLMTAVRKKWFESRLTAASAGFMIDMLLMGIWHGISPSYILYGAYHGALLSLTERYQKKSAFHKKHRNQRAYRLVSGILTFHLVMFGFYIFSGRLLETLMMAG